MNEVTDDYVGDHHVPKKGLAAAKQFQDDQRWEGLFAEIAADMKQILDATEETYGSTARSYDGCACCVVGEPTAEDRAMIHISRGFEQLTGDHREWALGCNCRFRQPSARDYSLTLAGGVNLPMPGVEFARSEQHSLEDST